MSDVTLRAQVLAEALPYIQKYYGKTIVIKYGGSAMISRELREAVIGDVILLSLVGIHVVVVHGGGPEISAMLKKLGKESRFVDGLRCTDAETMDVVQQVLCGKVNKNLAATLNRRGGRAIGLCGLDAGLFQARLLDAKYGLVGELARVDPAPVRDCLTAGYIPVVSTVAQGVDGENASNINADTAAARLAVALGAEKLILLTDVHVLLALQQLAHPLEGLLGAQLGVGHALLVLPVGGDAVLGGVVHLPGADLHLEGDALPADDGGVEGLVAVGLGGGDIVLEPAQHGVEQVVDDAQDIVALGHVVDDDPEGIEVEDLVHGLVLLHLLPPAD